VFSGSTENVMRWVAGAGIVLGLAAAAIMVVFLVRKPEWRVTAHAKWALLVGLLVLPGMTMLSGNVVGFHKVKNSCTQCHTMDPWVNDMKDPKTLTLAGKHYQNRWIPDDQCKEGTTGRRPRSAACRVAHGTSPAWEVRTKRAFSIDTPALPRRVSQNIEDRPGTSPDGEAGRRAFLLQCHRSPSRTGTPCDTAPKLRPSAL
jgi:hypothetical protein